MRGFLSFSASTAGLHTLKVRRSQLICTVVIVLEGCHDALSVMRSQIMQELLRPTSGERNITVLSVLRVCQSLSGVHRVIS